MAQPKKRRTAGTGKARTPPAARSRVLSSLTSDWYWEQDAQLRFTRVEVQGGSAGEQKLARRLIGKRRWETGTEIEGGWQAHQALLAAHAPFRDLLMWRDCDDGSRRHLRVSGEPLFDERRRFVGYRGIRRDVTEHRRAEQLLRLEHSVNRSLADAASEPEALRTALRAICESEGWDYAEYWKLDEAAGLLRRHVYWAEPDVPAAQRFAERSPALAVKPGVGLVGAVWRSGEPLWIADATRDPRTLRKELVADTGLRGTLKVPVRAAGSVVGVINCFCSRIRPPDARLLQALGVIATQIGQFLQRAQAEARLRESEERFRRSFELAGSGFAHLDLERRFLRVNRKLCEILGYSEQELIGREVTEFSYPDDLAVINPLRERLYAGEIDSVKLEKRYLRRDGSVVWAALTLALERDAGGAPLHEIAVYDDITARKSAETALRESEARFRRTFELAGVGAAHVGMDGRFLRVNRRLCEMLGYAEAELVGRSIKEISHPEDLDLTDARRARLHAGELDSVRFEKRYLHKDGSVLWIQLTVAVERDPQGRPLHEISILDDITDRKSAEQALRESEARWLRIIDSANEGILVYDRDLRVTAGNDAAADILGVPLAELIGKPGFMSLLSCVREDGTPLGDEDRPTRVTTRTGQPVTGMVIGILRAAGAVSWISVSTAFLRRPGETGHYGIVSTISDITAQKRGEQLLRLEHQVLRHFSEATDLSAALRAALRAICESEKWELGRYLQADFARGVLRFGEAWCVPHAAIERYVEESRRMEYAPGFGLAGTVWQSQQPLWVPDILEDPRVARSWLARETGLRGCLVVPVNSEARTVGVFIFHTRDIRAPDERLLQAVSVIGTQVGQLIKRAGAEQAMRASEDRFRSLTNLSSDWFWEQDADYRFTRLEGRYVAGGDKTLAANLIGSRRWESGLEIEGGWEAHRAALEARKPFYDQLMWRSMPGGGMRYLTVSGEPMFNPDGSFAGYRGVGRDVGPQKRSEQMLRLEHQVARALSEADDAGAGLKAVMRAVCEAEGWACGRYFGRDADAGVLRFRDGWGIPGLEPFLARSTDLVFRPGEGLAGRVWQSGEPVWSSDTLSDPRVANHVLAEGTGIRGAFAFPVISEGEAIGVLAFSSQQVRQPDERLLQATRVIGSQVGQFLQRKQAEESLRESEARFRSLTQMSSDFFWETDLQHRFTQLVHGANYSAKVSRALIGKTPWELAYITPEESAWGRLRADFDAHAPFRDFEFGRPWPDGSVRYFSVSGEPYFSAQQAFLGYRGVGRDITDVVLARERIASLAYHDPLTGLANRTSLGPTLEQAVERTRRRGSKLAGMFIDLDGFKPVNDAYGHDAGDRLLVEVAQRLRASLRASDPVARLGGDEFFVVLEDMHESGPIENVARKLLAGILRPFEIAPGRQASISASIGISLFPDDAGDAETLIKHADVAMYAVKQAGRNSWRFFKAGAAANDPTPAAARAPDSAS